jgi:surfactin synthase thioesterase subunit
VLRLVLMAAGSTVDWFGSAGRDDAAVRLICFPHAGGAVQQYAQWRDRLPRFAEVLVARLPGRGARAAEPWPTDVVGLARSAAEAVEPLGDRPFCLFGHSAGAVLAYEVARGLRMLGGPSPAVLLVSGRVAPHLPAPDGEPDLSDDGLRHTLRRHGGTPAALLEDTELVELILPALRADLAMLSGYRHRDEPPLDVPLVVLGGDDDPVTTDEGLRAWCHHTLSEFRLHLLRGGHFFVFTEPAVISVLTWWTLEAATRDS